MSMSVGQAYSLFMQKVEEKKYSESVSKSVFYSLRPTWVNILTPHDVCVCLYHGNYDFLIKVWNRLDLVLIDRNKLIDKLICQTPTEQCYFAECYRCKDNFPSEFFKCFLNDQVSQLDEVFWMSWQQPILSSKNEPTQSTTNKISLQRIGGSVRDFLDEMDSQCHYSNGFLGKSRPAQTARGHASSLETNQAAIFLVQTQNPSAVNSPRSSLHSGSHSPLNTSIPASTVVQTEPELPKDAAEIDWDDNHVKPSIIIEAIGILLLVCHFLYPAWASIKIIQQIPLFKRSGSPMNYENTLLASFVEVILLFLLIPTIQLAVYIICKWFLLGRVEPGTYKLYTIRYYYCWFVHRIWLLNGTALNAIVGTPIYNMYLRLCGARIGRNVHINTTFIDNPDLLTINDHTYIASSVTLATMSYEQRSYRLDAIRIGSSCSIQTRATLQHGVHMKNNILVKSMSFVSGNIATDSIVNGLIVTVDARPTVDYLFSTLVFSWTQIIYQFICIIFTFILQIFLWILLFATYLYLFSSASELYIFVVLPVIWLLTTFSNVIVAILSLLILVGRVSPGTYSVNSWYFLHKIWFRQLLVNTFAGSFFILGGYHALYPVFLRWFGAEVGEDVKISDIVTLLTGPSNLIRAGDGLTTNGKCLIAPIDVVDGRCWMQEVHIGNYTTLGNAITVHCGARIPGKCMIGTATRIEPDEIYAENKIVLGVSADELPFGLPTLQTSVSVEQTSKSCCSRLWYSLMENVLGIALATVLSKLVISICGICLVFFIFFGKQSTFPTLTNIFLLLPLLYILFMILMSCSLSTCYRWCNRDVWNVGTYEYKKVISWRRHLSWCLLVDFQTTVGTFIGGTQWLVYLMRGLGARVGRNVLLSDLFNLIDPQQLTVDENVRISGTSSVQCHTFEQRLFTLASTRIGRNSVLDHTAMVFSGCQLKGNNHIHPCTLIMKGDHLPPNTNWYGCPARVAAILKLQVERVNKAHDRP